MTTQPHEGIGRSARLQQLIASLIDGVVLAESDGTIIFANDAALAQHGCTAPRELGKGLADYRQRFQLRYLNNHRLEDSQYPLDRVARGQPFDEMTVTLTRRGQPEGSDAFARVLQMRGLMLESDGDATAVIALVIHDLTDQADAEERFERSFASNPAPAVILRIDDSRYIKANQGFVDMTGFDRSEIDGRPFHEMDVLAESGQRDAALLALRDHKTIPQQEAIIAIKGGLRKFVIVAGQPIEMADSPCMLFTFIDLDMHKKTEAELRQSQETFSRAFELAPVPMVICTQDKWRIKEANAAFLAFLGCTLEDAVSTSLDHFRARTGREARIELQAPLEVSMRGREVIFQTIGGANVDGLISTEEINIQGEPCVLCAIQDNTERKRSESDLLEAINAVMQDTSWFTRTLLEKLAQIRHSSERKADSTLESLTARERMVLERACRGETNTEIAAALDLSTNTVRNHISNIYSKIDVRRRSDAIIWGRERGLVPY